jgi:hypothetical protein
MKQHNLWIAAIAITGLSACSPDKDPTPRENDRSQEIASDATEQREGETDSATARRRAKWAWYNDDTSHVPARMDHAFSRKYMQFLHQAAAQERARHGSKIPTITRTSAAGGSIVTTLRPTGEDPQRVSGTTWVNIGPTTAAVEKNGSYTIPGVDAGRVRSIVPHPTNPLILYVAFAAAGVWKTTDGSVTWAAVTESLGSLSCGALAMDPSNPSTLYLGLGDPFDGTGIGLVKSTDAGATWSAPVYLGSSTQIRQLVVAPGNTSIVLAATEAGVYRSTDAGATFSQVSIATGQASAPAIWSIAWTGGSGFALTLEAAPAAASTDGQAWYSSDSGASWTRAAGFTKTTGIGRATLASAPSARATLYAYAAIPNSAASTDLADMFKSTNGGQTWTALAVTAKKYTNAKTTGINALLNGQGWYNQMIAVHPTNANIAYFGGALTHARTSDGGVTFYKASDWLSAPYVHADMHTAVFDSAGALYIGSDGGVFKSVNPLASPPTFAHLNNGLVTHLFYSVGSSLADPDAVIGGLQDNGTRVRVGATSTFNQYIGGDGFGADIHPNTATTMLGSLYYARIQKSTNGGVSWVSACSGITECNNSSTAPFYTKIVPWAGDASGNTVYTFSNTKVYKSTNYAGTWSSIGTSPTDGTATISIRNVGVAATDGNRIGVVTNGGRVFTSTNAGATWNLVRPPNNGLSLSYLWYDTSNANIVYVASVAPDSTKNHLWKSTDGGATFTAIDGGGFPFGVPVNSIKNDPTDPAHLFAGTHLGIYESSDGGLNWTRFGSGLPLVEVYDFYISPDSSLMRVATYGRGIWQLQ